MTGDPQQIQEIVQQRIAAGVSRQEIIFELERLGLTRAEASEQIDRNRATQSGIKVNGELVTSPSNAPGQRPIQRESIKPFYKQPRVLLGIVITGAVLAFYAFSYFSGPSLEDRIKDLNEAAQTDARSDGGTGKTNILDIRTGDCLDESFASGDLDDIQNANRVTCGSEATFLVASQEFLPDAKGTPYPGLTYFGVVANESCAADYAIYLYPTVDSWELGDRVITCIDFW